MLHRASRSAFAWEWLRRMPAYRSACLSAEGGDDLDAVRFGLHRFESANKAVPDARPIWRAGVDPAVVRAAVSPGQPGEGDGFDMGRLASIAACHRSEAGEEHWLLGDGQRHVRLDIVSGTLTTGPALLEYHISGLSRALPQLAALNRLVALARTGRMAPSLFPLEQRARRWTLVLRTWDALCAGMSQRDIACELFDLGELSRWRTAAPSWRRRVQRLVEAARRAADTDPRAWLSGAYP